MRIAFFTPWPPQRSGVAEYSRGLLPYLLEHADIDLWLDESPTRDAAAPCPTIIYPRQPDRLGELADYDTVIYQMGNSLVHRHILEVLLKFPGVVVMHDYVLHHLFAAHYLERLRDPQAYLREVRYNCGPPGETMARLALAGASPPLWEQEQAPALNHRVLDHATGVIAHSHYARRLISASHPHLPLVKLDLPVAVAPLPGRAALKQRHGLAPDRPVVAILGFASTAKRIELSIAALKLFGDLQATFIMVGEAGDLWRARLGQMKLAARVTITGYVDDASFDDYCRLADICVDLRSPTMGESSATCCRVMGAGGVCVVSDLGWYSELPDDCVIKIPPTAGAQALLSERLRELLDDADQRARIGRAARAYIGTCHRPADTAGGYLSFINQVKASREDNAITAAAVNELGQALADLGIEGHDEWAIRALAGDLADLDLAGNRPRTR